VKAKILIIDDDTDILLLLKTILVRAGYSVVCASSGGVGLKKAKTSKPDLIILDKGLPDIEGFTIFQLLKNDRHTSHIPVIFLTGRDKNEHDIISGLEEGADDYIVKPFNTKLLLARIKNIFRRVMGKTDEEILECGDVYINLSQRKVLIKGREIKNLTNKEFDLLCLFIKKSGQLLKYEYIYETIWNCEFTEYAIHTIEVHIYNLRKKLHSVSHKIVNIQGVGYRFEL